MERNEVIEKLPRHLLNLIIEQPYHSYTAQDHAVWRYIMRQNVRYLPLVAHPSYLEGLKRTGISVDRIPDMQNMNKILKELGWAAVTVDGFIPPAAFMEFQAYNVLVIAADIRPIDQILYTPAPDIVHEAAGHAPILADEEYAAYLREFGRVGTQAFSSAYDNKVYEAIRHLSILKADPYTSAEEIEKAESDLDFISRQQESPSEMALLRNLHWWTVEYGLIGSVENPKIYGAGLLSSIGESHNCMQPEVMKLPYSLAAKDYSFDITTQQPQLFVTPDFETLNRVLNEYRETMAVSRGGMEGLEKALNSESTATVVYSSGLQVSGRLSKIEEGATGAAYLSFKGAAMLSEGNVPLTGHGIQYHKDGFGSPVGKIRGISGRIEAMSNGELTVNGFIVGKELDLEFESGVKVSGRLEKITTKGGCNMLFTFAQCTVSYKGTELFCPEWGMYDMAIGESIVSVFAGPANADAFEVSYPAPVEKTHHIQYDEPTIKLHQMYEKVHQMRVKGGNIYVLIYIWNELHKNYPDEWLLPLEIAEDLIAVKDTSGTAQLIIEFLKGLQNTRKDLKGLIIDGLKLFDH